MPTSTNTPLSLSPLGPLTTLWTPPHDCLATVTFSQATTSGAASTDGHLYLGAAGNAVNAICYPPSFQTDRPYNPGICPSGWYSACTPTNNHSPLFATPTIGVQCCPTGLTCSRVGGAYDFAWCQQPPTDTPRVVFQPSANKQGNTVTTSYPHLELFAKPIMLALQPSDSSLLNIVTASAPLTSQSPTVQTTSPPTASSTSSSTLSHGSESSGGLSTGAKAGIGIGVALAVAALIGVAVFFFFFFRRRKHILLGSEPDWQEQHDLKPIQYTHMGSNAQEAGSEGQLHELGQSPVELGGSQRHWQSMPAELPPEGMEQRR